MSDSFSKKIRKSFFELKKIANLIIGASLLISGSCIGAGMIGLPVTTAALGFYPTIGVFFLVWLIMTFTALCMLEASLYVKGETNLIGMANATLGKLGGKLAWVVYILFLYSLMAAYTSGGSKMVANAMIADLLGFNLSSKFDMAIIATMFVIFFGFFVYLGTKYVDYLNRVLVVGLVTAYFGLIFFVDSNSSYIQQNSFGDIKFAMFAMPIIITSFGFHLIIPTLKYYLKENILALRAVMVLGGLIPLLVYFVWEYEILSLIPIRGENGLIAMLNSDSDPGELLVKSISSEFASTKYLISFFSLFALVSSFIGVGLGIFDFFADGLKIKKNNQGRILLALITFLPPLIYAITIPRGFMIALGYAGVFATILLIIYPALMVWCARYNKKLKSSYRVVGGKFSLGLVILFGALVILSDILLQLGFLPKPS